MCVVCWKRGTGEERERGAGGRGTIVCEEEHDKTGKVAAK
jgi:hypothetical protein